MKKLISIGVALALLTMAVVPGVVAAQDPPGCPPSEYTYPRTFATIPFAIIQSGFDLVGIILAGAGEDLGLPDWVDQALMSDIGGWAGGPLSWTVDMLGWGVALVGAVVTALPEELGVPAWIADVTDAIACQLFTPFACIEGEAFDPCGLLP